MILASVVDWLSVVTSSRTGPLLLSMCPRCKVTFKIVIYLSFNDFLILLRLVCFQINPSFITKVQVQL